MTANRRTSDCKEARAIAAPIYAATFKYLFRRSKKPQAQIELEALGIDEEVGAVRSTAIQKEGAASTTKIYQLTTYFKLSWEDLGRMMDRAALGLRGKALEDPPDPPGAPEKPPQTASEALELFRKLAMEELAAEALATTTAAHLGEKEELEMYRQFHRKMNRTNA